MCPEFPKMNNMKQLSWLFCLFVFLCLPSCLDKTVKPVEVNKSLPDKVINITIQHINIDGPDHDVAQFVSWYRHATWLRRNEFIELVIPYLEDKNPNKVAGAIEILYYFRCYHPMSYLGDFRKDNSEFFSQLDNSVYKHFIYFHSLKSDKVSRSLALYLGVSPTKKSKQELLRIAKETSAKEQALICLTWHRNPEDMKELFPFMLENTQAARSLPYHFRNSYGLAAVPYLKKVLVEAKSDLTRLEAAFELVHLRLPVGFEYLHKVTLKDERYLARIKQFARDYLELPKNISSKEDIANHLNRKKIELIDSIR